MDRARLVVVDDEERLCESLDILLTGKGYEVKSFADPREALHYVQNDSCDLVLLDLIMPDIDGYSVLSYIKKIMPDLPVIIMTAQGSAEYAVKALKSGAEDYICKPFEIEELCRRIENALEKKQLHQKYSVVAGKLAITEAQLRQAQKMEAIATLAGGIAHDFNNILMGLQGHLSILKHQLGESNPFASRLQNMEKLIESGSKLTSQLLGYARRGRYEVRPLNLNDVVQLTAETFKQLRKDIVVQLELGESISLIEADASQMEQVLMNLLVNAADAMPEGGHVFIKTEETQVTSTEHMHFPIKPGRYVLMSVRDEGIGMDAATKERIFEPFFTTKEMGRGTGLGLASVYGIVKGHNGYIDVKSQVGKGTTFYIYFPITKKQVKRGNAHHQQEVINGGGVILFVDDEEEIVKVGKTILEILGFKVICAGGGEEALKLYDQYQDEIDLVILDVVMPGLSGSVVFNRLKEKNPLLPILLISGYSWDREATAKIVTKADGFLQKPFRIEDLSQVIKKILSKKAERVAISN
ncbi:MAG: response regulator [Syntrophales bacterium]|nr:response regulator [Syntrophales bacterium]